MPSPYATPGSSGGSPYASGGSSGGSAAPSHSGGGGLLHTLVHLPGKTLTDLESSAINVIPGAYKVAKDALAPGSHPSVEKLVAEYGNLVQHPIRELKAENSSDKLSQDVEAMGRSAAQTVEHPLRHPGNTLLLALPAVSGAAKFGIAAREGELGLPAGATAERTLKVGDLTVHPEASRSGLGQATQKASDTLLQRAADKNPTGRAAGLLERKVGKTINAEAKQAARQAQAPAAALIKLGQRLDPGEQKALQVVAEQVPLHERITAASARVLGAKSPLTRAGHQEELALLHRAAPHLAEDETGKPVFATGETKLPHVFDAMTKVAGGRETLLKQLGMLTDESIQSRKTAAGRISAGQPATMAAAEERLTKLEREHQTAVDKIAAAKFGPPDRADVNFRTRENAKAARQAAGVDRSGRASGASGVKAKTRPTVKNEQRAQVERLVNDAIEKNPEHPALAAWAARTNEIEQLRKTVAGNEPDFAREPGAPAPESFTASPYAVRIPDVATRKGSKALSRGGSVGVQGTVGHLRAPGSVTHGFTGVLRENALRRQDTTTLVGESGLEAAKYAGLKHIHSLVRNAVSPLPLRPDDVAVRLDEFGPNVKMPLAVRKFLADPEEYFKHATPAEQASMLDKARSLHFFPGKNKGAGWQLDTGISDASKAEFERLHAENKIGFVPKRILGEMGNPSAPLRAVAPGKAVSSVDAINNASRFAILYLKPAYAIPNLLGNAALNVIQQGWAAPRNLAVAARITQKLEKTDYAKMDAAMGEGIARSVSAHGQGRLSKVVDVAAGKWGTVVDTPFRRASFIHEARQAGFKTSAQIHEFLNRDEHDPTLLKVGIKANRDAIDYENLTPFEKEIVRRVVFFYPWVKGSTVFAGRFLRDHPGWAAASGALGQQGQAFSESKLGPVPSYLQGLIPVGGNRVINPSSASILQTPAQVGMGLQGLASGNISDAAQLTNFATPALALALAETLRQNPSSGFTYKPGTNAGAVAEDVLGGSLPQVSLLKTLTGRSKSKLYPSTTANAIGQFLLGGIYPRTINKADLNSLAAAEQTRMKTGR